MVIENVLEYDKAIEQFSQMFPKISPEGIGKILTRDKNIYSHGNAVF